MKIFDIFKDDVTKMWSLGRITAAVAFFACVGYAGYSVYKLSVMPDLPSGWVTYILGAYGINKVSSTTLGLKAPAPD